VISSPARPSLSGEELRELRRVDDRRSLGAVCRILLGLVLCFVALGAFAHPVTWVLAFLLIGGLQHHLLILQHETLHYILFTSRRANEIVGHVSSWLIGFRLDYRAIHLRHHKALGEAGDPDLANYVNYPNRAGYVLMDLLRNISGLAAVRQFFAQRGADRAEGPAAGEGHGIVRGFLGLLSTQLVLFGALSFTLSWWHYPLFWLLPLVTVTKTLAHFRNVVEHARTRDIRNPEIARLRTILCNPLEAFFFAPLAFNYHAEHHLYTSIPYWQLARAHERLKRRPEYEAAVDLRRGYLRFLLSLCR